ncbi:MAG: UbiA family prenyltransferase [Candidatus Bathyarchaeota archaeon]|nr:UbiA family prenyltransferase [Candidatus Bathyarchaeota archaeon]
MSNNHRLKGLIALLRLPYWMMTGGLALLTSLAITKGSVDIQTALLSFLSLSFITSGGFSINDYFDRESDSIIKPRRPLPSGVLTLKQVITISVTLFVVGLVLAALINTLSFIILLIDSILLIIYSAIVKKKSGFVANILVGLLTGTAFLYGEATIFNTITLISLSLYPIAFGTIGGNVVRDILSREGDAKVGYPTLPLKVGDKAAVKIAAFFFTLCGVLAPLPYLIGNFSIFYLPLILCWSVLLLYSSFRLVTLEPIIANVRKYERLVTMSMMLLILSLIIEALSTTIGGLL